MSVIRRSSFSLTDRPSWPSIFSQVVRIFWALVRASRSWRSCFSFS
ncbi:MAG: hypothetical protein ABFD80_02520 [Acidobacteriota bacterium]